MERPPRQDVRTAELVLPCGDLDETVRFFTETLGLRLDAIHPADEPTVAVLSGHGLRLRLDRDAPGPAGLLRLACADAPAGGRELVAPNGMRVLLRPFPEPLEVPPLRAELTIARAGDACWTRGRAGMEYRDLIPGRQGGRFVASHLRIPGAGAVPDSVHFHDLRLQLIYCLRGQVTVVYEDQGPPFELRPGDCVLQPPGIRHRVLESSGGLEVVELACPAAHPTLIDHGLGLPTATLDEEREFSGQLFLRHRAAAASWKPAGRAGFEARELGVARASRGAASARVLRAGPGSTGPAAPGVHDGELLFHFILSGRLELELDGRAEPALAAGDAVVVPAGLSARWTGWDEELQVLEIAVG